MSESNICKQLFERGVELDKNGNVKKFNPNYFPKYIKSNYNIIFCKDNFYYNYENGVWQKQNEGKFLKYIRDIFQKPKFGIWSPSVEGAYITGIQRELYHAEDLNPNKNLINLKNGMFNIQKFELLHHDPNYYSTIQIPIDYNPDAKCPKFLNFIHEIFESDEEKIRIAQEWSGYIMTTATNAQKALILLGVGENGKGVFVDTLRCLIGEDNISNIPLNELNRGFSRVCIYNKTVNISGENEISDKFFNTQYFKAIVGEDMISAEQKNKPVFSFKPTAKLLMMMNRLPDIKDTSHGYFRRLCILPFNVTFTGKNRDNNLREKLKTELPGIFLWAAEGLKRLRENEYKFSSCKAMDEILKKYKVEQNPMYEFFDECIETIEDLKSKLGN